ncbi:MAG: S1C family serine protease [Acidimicrobiia bacterium]
MSEKKTGEGRHAGLWSAIAYFAGVALVVALVAWLAPQPDETEPAAVAETTTTTEDVEPERVLTGAEPVADAAEVILPSVVHVQTVVGVGSGVIYDAGGLIVTAAHVVQGEETVMIRLTDGRQFQGTVLGTAPEVDIAVIEVDATDLPAAEFSTGKPRVGQLAIAVGSPWNLASTVTSGIISAIDRPDCDRLTGVCISVIQTDAAINPGNSGGALVDREGKVVGINVSIFTESGANAGVGFAIPADTAVAYSNSIVSGESLVTGFLGVRASSVTEGGRAGARIEAVIPGTAADEAGIQVDDVVVSIAGIPVQGIEELAAQVRTHRPGEIVEVVLLRDGQEVVLQIPLGEPQESS